MFCRVCHSILPCILPDIDNGRAKAHGLANKTAGDLGRSGDANLETLEDSEQEI